MRLVTYENGGQRGAGIQSGDRVFFTGYHSMLDLIERRRARAGACRRGARDDRSRLL